MHSPQYVYAATTEEVIDGDTIDFKIDLGFSTTRKTRIRLKGIDTAEIYGTKEGSPEHERGEEQARFVRDWLGEKDRIILKTFKDKTGKYGRYLAEVYGDGKQLADALREKYPGL